MSAHTNMRWSDGEKFWIITVATLLAVGLTLSLGRWQLGRAAQKEQLQTSIAQRGREPVLTNAALLGPLSETVLMHRRIALQGQWLADKTVYLDNRQMNAKPGFYVLTPLQLTGQLDVVLVQRGWVARNFVDRVQVPRIETPSGVVTVSGRIVTAPSKLYELGQNESTAIRQNLDLTQYRAETGLALVALTVQQLGSSSEGLLRDWPQVGSGIEKHYGYAVQWFALSALLVILYVWFQIFKRRANRSRSRHGSD